MRKKLARGKRKVRKALNKVLPNGHTANSHVRVRAGAGIGAGAGAAVEGTSSEEASLPQAEFATLRLTVVKAVNLVKHHVFVDLQCDGSSASTAVARADNANHRGRAQVAGGGEDG